MKIFPHDIHGIPTRTSRKLEEVLAKLMRHSLNKQDAGIFIDLSKITDFASDGTDKRTRKKAYHLQGRTIQSCAPSELLMKIRKENQEDFSK